MERKSQRKERIDVRLGTRQTKWRSVFGFHRLSEGCRQVKERSSHENDGVIDSPQTEHGKRTAAVAPAKHAER